MRNLTKGRKSLQMWQVPDLRPPDSIRCWRFIFCQNMGRGGSKYPDPKVPHFGVGNTRNDDIYGLSGRIHSGNASQT